MIPPIFTLLPQENRRNDVLTSPNDEQLRPLCPPAPPLGPQEDPPCCEDDPFMLPPAVKMEEDHQ